MLNPGTLRHCISIASPSTAQDDFGSPISTLTPVLTCWANIRAATGKEIYAASGFVSQLSHVITIRFPTVTIRPGCKVSFRDRTFQVQVASDPDESREQLQLLCLEETS